MDHKERALTKKGFQPEEKGTREAEQYIQLF